MGNLMRQAQQMQENLKRAQEEIGKLSVTGEAGGGLVKVTIGGRHDAQRVEISPEAMKEDAEFLADLVAAAINDATAKLEQLSRDKMSAATAGMKLPPGLGF